MVIAAMCLMNEQQSRSKTGGRCEQVACDACCARLPSLLPARMLLCEAFGQPRGMQATAADVQQLFHVYKLGLGRAIAACTPRSDLDDLERVAVTLDCAGGAPCVTSAIVTSHCCAHAC